MEAIELTPLKTLKLKEQLLALLRSNASKESFWNGSRAAHLGHQPKPKVEVLACAIIRRSALATRMHDIRARTPVPAFLSALNSKAALLRPCTAFLCRLAPGS